MSYKTPITSTNPSLSIDTAPFPSNMSSIASPNTAAPFPSNLSSIGSPNTAAPFPSNTSSIGRPNTAPFPSNTSSIGSANTPAPFPSNLSSFGIPNTAPFPSNISSISSPNKAPFPSNLSSISSANTAPFPSSMSSITSPNTSAPFPSNLSSIGSPNMAPFPSNMISIGRANTAPFPCNMSSVGSPKTVPFPSNLSSISSANTAPFPSNMSSIGSANTAPFPSNMSSITSPNTVPFLSNLSSISSVNTAPFPSNPSSITSPNKAPFLSNMSSITSPNTVPFPSNMSSITTPNKAPFPSKMSSITTPDKAPFLSNMSSITSPNMAPFPSNMSSITGANMAPFQSITSSITSANSSSSSSMDTEPFPINMSSISSANSSSPMDTSPSPSNTSSISSANSSSPMDTAPFLSNMSSISSSDSLLLSLGTAPFLSKTYDMVDDPATDSIVSWGKTGNTFVVWSVPEFARDLLPKHFKHNNFSSFVRQLNTYGFRKVDPDRWEFANEGFVRGQKHLLKIISRKKPTQVHNTHQPPPQMQDKSVKSCVEIGNFGIEEEVERLKRDKNVLMQELVRLRQQQQTTDHHLQTVGQRVQVMEQRQQQMMSFLAKAMQSPRFLSQLVPQQGESDRRTKRVSKKRRLPNQEEGSNSISEKAVVSPNGQIVKFQPLMNEAAKAMLGQIMKMNGSPRLESTMNDSFLSNNMQSFADSSSSRVSGTSLSKSLSISSQSFLSTELEIPATCSSASVCESSHPVAANPAQNPVINVTPQQHAFVFDMSPVQSLLSENHPQVCGFDFQVSETGNTGFTGSVPGLVDNLTPVTTGSVPGLVDNPTPVINKDFPLDPHVDHVLDEMPKLPGINDIFWEQFLSVIPLVGDLDEIDPKPLESCMSTEQDWQKGQESEWEKIQRMTHLTEQMGLLAAEARRV